MNTRPLAHLFTQTGAALLLLLCAAPITAAHQSRTPTPVATAMAWRGEWIVQRGPDSSPLETSNRLPPGAILRAPATPTDAFVTVVYRDGQSATFECPRDCEAPIRLKTNVAPTPSAWSARWNDLLGLFWGNPEGYRTTIGRGDAIDRELVVRLDTDCVDIAAALGGVPHGPYRASLRPVAPGEPADEAVGVHRDFDWDGTACLHTSSSLLPGLYEVHVKQGESTADAVAPFWVLFLRSDRYADAAAAYRDARRVLEGVEASERRAMLRAFIDLLARESSR